MQINDQIKILLKALRDHDSEKDFQQLFDLLHDRFFRICSYYLKKDELAQEAVLDVFFTLWNKRKELTSITHFENWCFILLKNTSLNYLAKTNKIPESVEHYPEAHQTETTPEDQLLNEELLQLYVCAIDELPPRCREIFILIREQGLTYQETANRLNISIKTVDAQLQKAVTQLKTKINNYFSATK